MTDNPSTNGSNGERNPDGTFAKGNSGGPGNPHAARIAKLRAALIEAVTPEDITAIVKRLISEARDGDLTAVKIVFERTLGKPLEADILERIEAIEAQIEDKT